MASRPDEPYTVALRGFSDFERGELSSFLHFSQAPSYVEGPSLERCRFVLADADDAQSVRAVTAAGRMADTVFIGTAAPPGAHAWLCRPVDTAQVAQQLEHLVRQAASPPSAAGAPGAAGAPHGGMPALGRLDVAGDGSRRDVLVVEDSPIARRFLQVRLQQHGYRVHLAQDGEEALAALRSGRFALVFLDIGLGGAGRLDGLAVCQQLKQDPALAGAGSPKVVMVTGLASATDRVRGTLAGCDAYLTKPLVEAEWLHALRTLDPGFAAREKG